MNYDKDYWAEIVVAIKGVTEIGVANDERDKYQEKKLTE